MPSPQMANYLALDRPRSDAAQPLPGTVSNLHSRHTQLLPRDILAPSPEDAHSFVSKGPPKHRRLTPAQPSQPRPTTLGARTRSMLAQEQEPPRSQPLPFWLLVTLGICFGPKSSTPRTLTSHGPPSTLCAPAHSLHPRVPVPTGRSGARGAPPLATREHSLPFEPPPCQDALLTLWFSC